MSRERLSRWGGYLGVLALFLGLANAWGWTAILGCVLVAQSVALQFRRGWASA